MKQEITIKQLNELNFKQREKLTTWYDGIHGITLYMQDFPSGAYLHPILSIGEMIEFLKNESGFNLDYSSLDNTWGVTIGEYEKGSKELVDALWEAVKGVLDNA